MKTLIENSIKIKGIGRSISKTIFNSEEKNVSKYYDVSLLSGKKVYFSYRFIDGETTGESSISVRIPENSTELEVKNQVLAAINNQLN